MQLKTAGSAGALYLLSPVAVPRLTLKTRGGAHYYNESSQSYPQRARETQACAVRSPLQKILDKLYSVIVKYNTVDRSRR